MDFVAFFGLIGTAILSFVFSYDIVCQWSQNLKTRMAQRPHCMQIGLDQLGRAIHPPKFSHVWTWNEMPTPIFSEFP